MNISITSSIVQIPRSVHPSCSFTIIPPNHNFLTHVDYTLSSDQVISRWTREENCYAEVMLVLDPLRVGIEPRPNGGALRKCILKGPYTPTIVTTPVVPATGDSPAVPEQTTVETVTHMTPKNRAHFESEKEAIHLILTGIGDEIYSTVDAC
ncbi:hypothetical protein Tco_0213429 [Tanacetum coccineum]